MTVIGGLPGRALATRIVIVSATSAIPPISHGSARGADVAGEEEVIGFAIGDDVADVLRALSGVTVGCSKESDSVTVDEAGNDVDDSESAIDATSVWSFASASSASTDSDPEDASALLMVEIPVSSTAMIPVRIA